MLEDKSPIAQAMLASLFTWGFTAAGAATVFVFNSYKVKIYFKHISLFSAFFLL
jgi:hypothetical protein